VLGVSHPSIWSAKLKHSDFRAARVQFSKARYYTSVDDVWWKPLHESTQYDGKTGKVVQSIEDLAAYQYNQSDGLSRSINSWATLLRGWLVKPNRTTIKAFLLQSANSRPPPGPHSDTIFNFAQVREYLSGYPELKGLLRDAAG